MAALIAPAHAHAEMAADSVILVIDDDASSIEYVQEALSTRSVAIFGATDAQAGIAKLRTLRPRLVLLDLILPGTNGLQLMQTIQDIDPEVQVIIFTGHYSTESAVQAIQSGAYDYLNKPVAVAALRDRVDRWIEEERQRRKASQLESELLGTSEYAGIVGRNPVMLELLSKIRRIAPHYSTLLVTGETGTGKDLIARSLHAFSARAGQFVVGNCAAIVETLFESELFGHLKGSFTGATEDRKGLAECADRGTLFLDEVSELALPVQAKLLRFLQNREVQKVGSRNIRMVDVRIIAATNQDLRQMVNEGRFREDLFYRLSVVQFKLPRLCERKEDLPLLERHFMRMMSERYNKPGLTLSRRAQALLSRYSWPGNIRELENVLSYACMLADDEVVDLPDFPEYMLSLEPSGGEELQTMAKMQYEHAVRVLRKCNGNRTSAAEVLGIGRATLYRLLARE